MDVSKEFKLISKTYLLENPFLIQVIKEKADQFYYKNKLLDEKDAEDIKKSIIHAQLNPIN